MEAELHQLWTTGETENQFILYIGGLFVVLYILILLVGYTQRRCQSVVVALTDTDNQEDIHEYILVIKTSLFPYSSCRSTTRVYVQLQGQYKNSPFFLLKKYSITKDILARGSVDIFVIHTEGSLGSLYSVGLKLVDDIHPKSVWKPSQLQIYSVEDETWWSSKRIPELVCHERFDTHVMLEIRTGDMRKWSLDFLTCLFSNHQWLSLTMGPTRFGFYSTFMNLQLFFCTLALILVACMCCLIISVHNENVFFVTHIKVMDCFLATLLVFSVSLIFEVIARNVKPLSTFKTYDFKGLHELKKSNLENERIYKEEDNDFPTSEETRLSEQIHKRKFIGDLLNLLEKHKEMNTKDGKEGKEIKRRKFATYLSLVDADDSLNEVKSEQSSSNQMLTYHITMVNSIFEINYEPKRKTERKVTFRSETDENSNAITSSGDTLIKNKEFEQKKNAFSTYFPNEKSESVITDFHLSESVIEELQLSDTDNTNVTFSDQLELSRYHARSFLVLISELSTHRPLEVKEFKKCFQILQKSLSKNLLNFLTMSERSVYFKVVFSGQTNDWSREFDYRSFCDKEIISLGQEDDCRQFVSRKCIPTIKLNPQGDRDYYDPLIVINKQKQPEMEEETDDIPTMGGHLYYKPQFLLCRRDKRLFIHCKCMKEYCSKCKRLVSIVSALSHVIVRNSFVMTMETSVDISMTQTERALHESNILKLLTEMIYMLINSVMAVIMEPNVAVKVDEVILMLESVAAVVTHQVLNEVVKKRKMHTQLYEIQRTSQMIVTEFLDKTVSELSFETTMEAVIQDVCNSAIQTASEEVWEELQNPVIYFAELLLKESTIQQIQHLLDANPENLMLLMLSVVTTAWKNKLEELAIPPNILLAHSLIDRFEKRVYKIIDLFESATEYNEVQKHIDETCVNLANELTTAIPKQMWRESSQSSLEDMPNATQYVSCSLEIRVGNILTKYVKEVKEKSESILHEVFWKLISSNLVKMAVIKAKLTQYNELEVIRNLSTSPLSLQDIKELACDLYPLKNYLKYVQRQIKERNMKELAKRQKKMARKQKEYVLVNLQNMKDMTNAVDDLPRDYSDEELFVVEWFVTNNLYKPLPTWIKPLLILTILALTLLSLVYVVLKGSELTTVECQEWVCLVAISCLFYGCFFEPLKVSIILLKEYRKNGVDDDLGLLPKVPLTLSMSEEEML